MSKNRVEKLETKVAELESTVTGLTEELVEAKERIRDLEAEIEPEPADGSQFPGGAGRNRERDRRPERDRDRRPERDPDAGRDPDVDRAADRGPAAGSGTEEAGPLGGKAVGEGFDDAFDGASGGDGPADPAGEKACGEGDKGEGNNEKDETTEESGDDIIVA